MGVFDDYLCFMQDGMSRWYCVPVSLADEFERLHLECSLSGNFKAFEKKFKKDIVHIPISSFMFKGLRIRKLGD